MSYISESINRHFFMSFGFMLFGIPFFLFTGIAFIRKVVDAWPDRSSYPYLMYKARAMIVIGSMLVLFSAFAVVLCTYFSRNYFKDYNRVKNKDYIVITATVEFVEPPSDSGGWTVTFKNVETNEEIRIYAQSEEPKVGETVTLYYLPNTRIGRWIRIEPLINDV